MALAAVQVLVFEPVLAAVLVVVAVELVQTAAAVALAPDVLNMVGVQVDQLPPEKNYLQVNHNSPILVLVYEVHPLSLVLRF